MGKQRAPPPPTTSHIMQPCNDHAHDMSALANHRAWLAEMCAKQPAPSTFTTGRAPASLTLFADNFSGSSDAFDSDTHYTQSPDDFVDLDEQPVYRSLPMLAFEEDDHADFIDEPVYRSLSFDSMFADSLTMAEVEMPAPECRMPPLVRRQ